jgi:hypothetical protein
MKIRISMAVLSVLFIVLMVIAPVNACTLKACHPCKPTVVLCSFNALLENVLDAGKVWWTCDNTILHVRGAVSEFSLVYVISYGSPPTVLPTVWLIGTMEMVTDFDFNTKTGKGNAFQTWDMTFSPTKNYPSYTPVNEPNPIGLGTLKGKSIDKVTSIYGVVAGSGEMLPGDATGFLVATHGTGDFKNGKLMSDTTSQPYRLPPPVPYPWAERILVGWDGTLPAVPTGVLLLHR